MKKIRFYIRDHGKALWKDFYIGIPMMILLVLLFIIGNTIIEFLKGVGSVFTDHIGLQILIGLGIIILVGVGSRNLKRFKFFKKYLPSEIVAQPEVAYFDISGVLQLRVFIKTHPVVINDRSIEMGEVRPAQASPTSWGQLQGELVPMDKLFYTKRTQGNILLSCATLGAKTKDIHLDIRN